MGLRLKEGVDLARYAAISGHAIDENAVAHLQDIGMAERHGDRLIVSDQGVIVLNAVIETLLP